MVHLSPLLCRIGGKRTWVTCLQALQVHNELGREGAVFMLFSGFEGTQLSQEARLDASTQLRIPTLFCGM